MLKSQIAQLLPIVNGSDTWKGQVDPPGNVYTEMYLYNITNPNEVMVGARPLLTEVGPITFIETREKREVAWHDNGTVTYREARFMYFQPDMSIDNLDEEIFMLDVVSAGLVHQLRQLPIPALTQPVGKRLINGILKENITLLMNTTAREFIFGYTDSRINTIKKSLMSLATFADTFRATSVANSMREEAHKLDPYLSAFTGERERNGSDIDVFTVFTGETDINKYLKVNVWNGRSKMDNWNTPWANMMNGTNGAGFHPFVKPEDVLYIFAAEICRSIPFEYVSATHFRGLDVLRFELPRYTWLNSTEYPANIGYCPRHFFNGTVPPTASPEVTCLDAGVLPMEACMGPDRPLIYSLPHFLNAAEQYQEHFPSLSPDASKHNVYLYLEPTTGAIVHFSKTLQMNWPVEYFEHVPGFDAIPKGRVIPWPFIWVNQTVVLDDLVFNALNEMLFDPIRLVKVLCYVGIAVGCALLLVITSFLLFKLNQPTDLSPQAENYDMSHL